eukprot:1162075-Pelagomonas_calceolata.AAC.8
MYAVPCVGYTCKKCTQHLVLHEPALQLLHLPTLFVVGLQGLKKTTKWRKTKRRNGEEQKVCH